jgi:hypothetical protein
VGGEALEFIRGALWRDGRLLATCKDGRAHLNAYLDDYAFLADAVLELLQVRWSSADAGLLRELLEALVVHFEDRAGGGFYFTSDDHEALIHRSKSFADDATPSGNGIAALVLQRGGWLLGEPRYLAAAERTLQAAWHAMEHHPQAHTSLLTALDEYLRPPDILVLRGAAAEIGRWQHEIDHLYCPRRLVFAIPADASALPESLASKTPPAGSAVAYLCRGPSCSPPIESLEALVRSLRHGVGMPVAPPGT